MTDSDLIAEGWRKLAATSPGPWTPDSDRTLSLHSHDADFASWCRTHVWYLLEQLESVQTELDTYKRNLFPFPTSGVKNASQESTQDPGTTA